jgi:hypothetical protein
MKIRIETPEEDKQIVLADCEPGELVKLENGLICLVVQSLGVVSDTYTSKGLAAVWLKDKGAEMCKAFAEDMIPGRGCRRIAERLGKLVVEEGYGR